MANENSRRLEVIEVGDPPGKKLLRIVENRRGHVAVLSEVVRQPFELARVIQAYKVKWRVSEIKYFDSLESADSGRVG